MHQAFKAGLMQYGMIKSVKKAAVDVPPIGADVTSVGADADESAEGAPTEPGNETGDSDGQQVAPPGRDEPRVIP